jgi:hypothetical protein
MDESTWKALIDLQEANEKKAIELDFERGQALVTDGTRNNDAHIPDVENSCWQLYKEKLKSKGFAEESIDEIERATLMILKRLNGDTRDSGPVKGLVIGNVQSGKTANIAALMAMAADCGWNMFIILSGTIENLRIQMRNRLNSDLNIDGGNLTWHCLEKLSAGSSTDSQTCFFDYKSKQRYFTVSLKNASRLRDLIQWLQKDPKKMRQMRILLIDDEADQAGINTANVTTSDRKKINRLICALVNGKTSQSKAAKEKYLAMNYIGYTATPYANILNESSLESLYPKNFIATLGVSNQYFGPQQIFGSTDGQYDGLDIIRTVPKADLDLIKELHKGNTTDLPDSFVDAVCWFICCIASLRLRNHREPISMLVHTSQQVLHHANVSDAVESWFNDTDKGTILKRCRDVWSSETSQLPLEEFKDQYKDYGLLDSVKDYPTFEEIEVGIRKILSVDLKPIMMDEEGALTYHEGIHLCVDNSKNNGVNDENEFLRLVYPDKKNMPEVAPAFLVIGGATLSRGLTLEGLTCTFFLRSVKQADTLMQMGRWFGYRRGYELYPRVWLTGNTLDQFEFLSTLDQELREEIHMMEINGLNPDRYAARIRNSPKLSFIRITAKNRMQEAQAADWDFSGSFNQTYVFDDDKDILEGNLEAGRKFIESLGRPRTQKPCNPHSEHAVVFENVQFPVVEAFLRECKFYHNLSVFGNLDPLLEWIGKITADGNLKNWNVVLAGKKSKSGGKTWKLGNCEVAMVTRTRKNTKNEKQGVINIGALRAPGDLIADVDLDGKPQEVKDFFANLPENRMKEARRVAGLDTTPQLLLYIVDKDSEPKPGSVSRKPLKAPTDILGVCINIPGGADNTNYVARVSIRIDQSLISSMDIEDDYDDEDDQ